MARRHGPARPTLNEAPYQHRIMALAERTGWRQMHVRRSRAGKAWVTNAVDRRGPIRGWPDLVLLKGGCPGRLVVLEIKGDNGKATPEQLAWIAAFQSVPGCEAYVVGPDDWTLVVDLLTEPVRPCPPAG